MQVKSKISNNLIKTILSSDTLQSSALLHVMKFVHFLQQKSSFAHEIVQLCVQLNSSRAVYQYVLQRLVVQQRVSQRCRLLRYTINIVQSAGQCSFNERGMMPFTTDDCSKVSILVEFLINCQLHNLLTFLQKCKAPLHTKLTLTDCGIGNTNLLGSSSSVLGYDCFYMK